jgi:hypothetical protein
VTDTIEARLTDLAGLLRESQLLGQRRAELDARLTQQAAELHGLRDRHADEARDVERLENLSLWGTQARELSREQTEALQVRYRLAEAENRLAAIHAEREAVAARLAAFADLPSRYAAALDDKERHLRESGGPHLTRVLALAEERGRIEAELRELTEAAGAADAALSALGEVRRQLDLASSRQTADSWLGGALLAGKPHWLDGIAWAAGHADRCLAVLHTELGDVGLQQPLGRVLTVAQPTGLSQVFFSDLTLRDRINHAIRATDDSASRVEQVRRQVAAVTAAARTRWDALMRERRDLLTA